MNHGTDSHDANRFDFIRIVAALMVLYSHCYPLFQFGLNDPLAKTPLVSFGSVGVWIYFVISGYLVFQSLERSRGLSEFLIKRVLRIYPGLIVVCCFSVFIVGAIFTPFDLKTYFSHKQTHLYAFTATGFNIQYNLPLVFADNPKPHTVNGSLWSIEYEISCYLAMAVLCAFRPWRLWALALSPVIIIIIGYLRYKTQPASSFEQFMGFDQYHVTLGFLFSMGAFFAAFKERIFPSLPMIVAQLVIFFVLPEPFNAILLYTTFASIVLYVGHSCSFLPKIPKKIGDLSYGTYLFAFPIQQSLIASGAGSLGMPAFIAASTAITLCFAYLSWHVVEKPALRLKKYFGDSSIQPV